jgi:hypothetical protein
MNDFIPGFTGIENLFEMSYEERKIVVAQGVDFRDEDMRHKRTKSPKAGEALFDFLERKFGSEIDISGNTAEYTSDLQKVHYIVEKVHSKEEFRKALNTEGLHVIYAGHSRYGRGTCFDSEAPSDNYKEGERWEQGTNNNNGIFRLAYPYVPVDIDDVAHHKYHFAPVPVEFGAPPSTERHPDARRQLSKLTLPDDLKQYVVTEFTSPSDQYYGYKRGKEINFLFHAGWEYTRSDPYDIGNSEMRCKTFCHFGCSSKQHFWRIVRKEGYKNWVRDNPPENRFAYFTTGASDHRSDGYWIYFLFKYDKQNNFQSWWKSLENAKTKANRLLSAERAGYSLY